MEIIDTLEGTPDYYLDVDEVDLSPTEEKEQNIFFNNAQAQGSYDSELLKALAESTPDMDWTATAFDNMDLDIMFGDDNPLTGKLSAAPPTAQQAGADILKTAQARQNAKAMEGTFDEDPDDSELGEDEKKLTQEEIDALAKGKKVETPEERIERMRREKKEGKERDIEQKDSEIYLTIVAPSREIIEDLAKHLELDPGVKMVDAAAIYRALGKEMPKAPDFVTNGAIIGARQSRKAAAPAEPAQ